MKCRLVDITCFKHTETKKAIFVSDEGSRKNGVWLPRSQIEIENGRSENVINVTMPEWLALEKGLI